jgi:diguanylate cyclase (GGDEF)-like protein/PAS domain S-box-containing protein
MLDMDKERFLEVLLETIEDGIVVLDRDFNITLANKWMERRYSSEMPLNGKKCYAVMHGRRDRCPECRYAKSLETGTPQTQVVKVSSDPNPAEWLEISTYAFEDPNGEVIGAIEHVKDVTDRYQVEELLKDEISRRRLLVEQSRDGIVILDSNGKVHEANRQFARMLGYSMEEVQQLSAWDWDTLVTREELLEMIAKVDTSGDHFETQHRRKDGTLYAVEISTNGAVYGGQKLVFCVCRDITERKVLEAKIQELAIRDPLTDVYNRRHVFERLGETVAEHSRNGGDFCVSILDIDHFKAVNDTYGHLAGDAVLGEFARMVASVIRPYDVLGRYGGEEFIVVSKNAGPADTGAILERVMSMVREKAFLFEDREIQITVSCGLAESSEFAPGDLSVETLLARADRRLYEAKAAGRDRCVGPLTPALRAL